MQVSAGVFSASCLTSSRPMPLLDPVTKMFPPSVSDMSADEVSESCERVALQQLYMCWCHQKLGVPQYELGLCRSSGAWLPRGTFYLHVTCLDNLELTNLCVLSPLWVKGCSYLKRLTCLSFLRLVLASFHSGERVKSQPSLLNFFKHAAPKTVNQ